MASYKDIIPKFNPYVEQRPVEAMMKVGMYKQQRYDEGLQKIQESIDNVAGLDVVRDVDKQYLQSKLNQLGSQLSMVAGGDFSNFQLVNSVNGMTNQISKDPNVLNAVSNSAKYRKDLETIEQFKKDGKWADSNQQYFNEGVSSWYNNPDISTSYNSNLSPYIDTTKEATEIVKSLAKDYTENDVYYDPQTGQVLDVMTQQKIEGITPEKIMTALKTGLSPQAWKQLSIDGQYKYSNASSESYVNQINQSYQKTFSQYSERRESLMNDVNKAKTQEEKDKIMLEVEQIDRNIEGIKNEYNSISRGFETGDVKSSQSQYYTMQWIENMSNAMSSRGVSSTIKESPYFTTKMKTLNYNLEIQKFEETKRQNQFKRDIEYAKLLEEQREKNPFGGGIPLPEPTEGAAKTIQTAQANVKTKEEVVTKELQILSQSFGWSTEETIPVLDKNGKPLLDKNGNPLMESQADQQVREIIDNGPSKSNSQMYNMVKVYYDKNQEYIQEMNRVTTALTEAEKQVPINVDTAIPDKYKDQTWQGYNVYDTINLIRKFGQIERDNASVGDPSAINAAREILSPKEFDMYRYVYKGNIAPLGGNKDARSAYMLMQAVNSTINRGLEEREKIAADILYQNTPMWQRTRVPIILEKPAVKAKVDDYIGTILGVEGGWPGLSTNDIDKLSGMQGEVNSAAFITKDKLLNVQSGGESVNIPLTDEQWSIMTQEYSRQVNASPEVQMFDRDILPQLLVTNPSFTEKGFWTTAEPNPDTGKSDFNTNVSNAHFKSYSFPSVNTYSVSGNFVTTQNPRESFSDGYFYLNIDNIIGYDKTTGAKTSLKIEGQPFPKPMSKSQASTFLQSVTDQILYEYIRKQYPNYTIVDPKNISE
jgi:hypothetical protein